ncbi:MAG: hypothetical protein PVJ19_05250 [Desulfobacteraceae bacterium]
MIKIDRVTIRLYGGTLPVNYHQGVCLAQAIGESLAGNAGDHPIKNSTSIDRIAILRPSPGSTQHTNLADDISRRILSQIYTLR